MRRREAPLIHACFEPRSFRAWGPDVSSKKLHHLFLTSAGSRCRRLEGSMPLSAIFASSLRVMPGKLPLPGITRRGKNQSYICPRQGLFMGGCSEIPAAAWQQLVDGATWPKLTNVSFSWRLGGQLWGSGGAEVLCRLGCKKPPVLDVLMPRRSSAEGASEASPKASRLRLGSSPSSAAAPS